MIQDRVSAAVWNGDFKALNELFFKGRAHGVDDVKWYESIVINSYSFSLQNDSRWNGYGWKLLHAAAFQGSLAMVKYLVQCGANVLDNDYYGNRPSQVTQNVDVKKFLVGIEQQKKASGRVLVDADTKESIGVLTVDTQGSEQLSQQGKEQALSAQAYIAKEWHAWLNEQLLKKIKAGDADAVVTLVGQGADINAADEDGWTGLHYAASFSRKDIMLYLLSCDNININAQDREGRSALHRAIEANEDALAILLVKNGADINLPDNKGMTPLALGQDQIFSDELKQNAYDRQQQDDGKASAAPVLSESGSEDNQTGTVSSENGSEENMSVVA